MNTKKYLIIAGAGIIILGGIFISVLAAINYFYPKPMVVQISPNGNVLLRGTVVSVGSNSLAIKSWAGDWTINISPSTEFMPNTNISQFKTGDFIDVQGYVNQNGSWTIDATSVSDLTQNQNQNQTSLLWTWESLGCGSSAACLYNVCSVANPKTCYSCRGKLIDGGEKLPEKDENPQTTSNFFCELSK